MMKIEVGKKYKDSDGDIFTLVHISITNILVIENIRGSVLLYQADDFGKYFSEYTEPEKLSGWINVYENYPVSVHYTKEIADKAQYKRLACIDLSKFNVGEGL